MEDSPNMKTVGIALLISAMLITGVYIAFSKAKTAKSAIVLPGGITYLGPTPTTSQPDTHFSALAARVIPVPPNTPWAEYKGKQFPYTFSYPTSLALGVFPNDPYEGVTIFYGNLNAQENLFFRVDNLTVLNKKEYIGKPLEYASNWHKEYTWADVASVTAFTNSKGLKGYRAKYKDDKGNTPYDHVFFEVPANTNLVIWISGKLFEQAVFDQLVDSVSWE
jgi:hypothetical protein